MLSSFLKPCVTLADVHVFKMSGGRVDYAMAIVGPASPDPWVAREKK